jgi:hypothetical protein
MKDGDEGLVTLRSPPVFMLSCFPVKILGGTNREGIPGEF